jgi:hypothetical protein
MKKESKNTIIWVNVNSLEARSVFIALSTFPLFDQFAS